jgi:hypothetical protein
MHVRTRTNTQPPTHGRTQPHTHARMHTNQQTDARMHATKACMNARTHQRAQLMRARAMQRTHPCTRCIAPLQSMHAWTRAPSSHTHACAYKDTHTPTQCKPMRVRNQARMQPAYACNQRTHTGAHIHTTNTRRHARMHPPYRTHTSARTSACA